MVTISEYHGAEVTASMDEMGQKAGKASAFRVEGKIIS